MMLRATRSRSHGPVAEIILLVALPILMAATPSGAADRVWNNSSGGLWSDAANWTPADVPDSYGETAILPALGGPYQVTLDLNPAIDAVQLANGSTLAIGSASIAAVNQVTNAGTILGFHGVYDGGRMHNESGGVIRCAVDDSIRISGTITNNGTIVIGPENVSGLFLDGGTMFQGSGTLLMEGAARLNSPLDRPQTAIWLINAAGHTVRGSCHAWVPVQNYGLLHGDGSGTGGMVLHHYFKNFGTTKVTGGGFVNVDCPLVKNTGGTIIGTDGTFSVWVGPYGNTGTIDNTGGGTLVADGGDLFLACGSLLNGSINRNGSVGAVRITIATPQNLVISPGAEATAEGQIDLMASGSSLFNYGTVRVRGWLNSGGFEHDSVTLGGNGEVVLEGGTLQTNLEHGCTMINGPESKIRGCGFINANLLNLGTLEVDCGSGNLRPSGASRITNPSTIRIRRGLLWLREPGAQIINAGGTITATGSTGGQIVIERGATIDNTGGTIVADAAPVTLGWHTSANITGGTLLGSGPYTNSAQTTLRDVTLGPSVVFVTAAGATTRARGVSVTNQGTNRVVAGGNFTADPTTDYVQAAGSTVLEGGTLTVPRGVQVEGALRGAGTIVGNVTNSGEVAPDAAGTGVQIQGDYHQLADGRLSIGISGSSTFSRLDVTGAAFLDGALSVSLLNGFDPGAGQMFDVMSFGSRTGEFAVASGAGLELVPFYGAATAGFEVKCAVTAVEPGSVPTSLRFYSRGAAFALDLPAAAEVTVRAFDVIGREVATLASGARAAGVHSFALRGAGGSRPPSGVFFARAEVKFAGRLEVRNARVVLVK